MSQNANIPQTGEEREREQERAQKQQEKQQDKRSDNKALANSPLHTDKGDTKIEENVVSKIAGIATREVNGVYAMGNAARRAFNSITERIPGAQTNVSGGVSVEKGETQTAIDVTIIIDYGASVVDVADQIRRNVIGNVESATGLEVVEVNVTVSDVHLPDDDSDQGSSSSSSSNKELN